MDSPSGAEDLQSQVEDIEREEKALRDKKLALVKLTEHPVVIEEDGQLSVLDDEDKPWPYDTVELSGNLVEVRKPKPEALQAFNMAVSPHSSNEIRNKYTTLFMLKHLSEKSYDWLLGRMSDPDDEFSFSDFADLMKAIATLGTGRPTEPSSA